MAVDLFVVPRDRYYDMVMIDPYKPNPMMMSEYDSIERAIIECYGLTSSSSEGWNTYSIDV